MRLAMLYENPWIYLRHFLKVYHFLTPLEKFLNEVSHLVHALKIKKYNPTSEI